MYQRNVREKVKKIIQKKNIKPQFSNQVHYKQHFEINTAKMDLFMKTSILKTFFYLLVKILFFKFTSSCGDF